MEAESNPSSPAACRGCAERDQRIAGLEAKVAALGERVAELTARLESAARGGKRQAAPFSKGSPKADSKKPGRKSGDDYGTVARREIPAAIDEVHEAPIANPACPKCGGALVPDGVVEQYQTEIPRRPIIRRFNVHVARCACCDTRVQGRHPLQTSNAVGCCQSQLGPDAQSAIVHLNKVGGLSHGKITGVFSKLFGIAVSRGGVCQAMLRAARRCEGDYDQLVRSVGAAPWLVPDETGWRIGGKSAWLHVCVMPDAAVYHIDRARGFEGSSKLIPADYKGTMIHDGYKPYRRYRDAIHQTCLGHLLRRGHEILETAVGGAVRFPRKIKAVLQQSLAIRDQRDAGAITLEQAAKQAEVLRVEVRRITQRPKTNAENDRFSRHLYQSQHNLFVFLKTPGIDATNHQAEQSLRPAVVNRKVWGGNRTQTGSKAQSILTSVVGTAAKRGLEAVDWLSAKLRDATMILRPTPARPETG